MAIRRYGALAAALPQVVLVLVLAAGGVACDAWSLLPTRVDPQYCDERTPCRDSQTTCQLATHTCVAAALPDLGAPDLVPAPCPGSEACPVEAPVCDNGKCRACAGPTDDAQCVRHGAATPRCLATGQCGACRADSSATDCGGVKPVCDTTGSCRACAQHGECPSKVCLADGTCAEAANIAYVDNQGIDASDCRPVGTHDGTATFPYCAIQDAIGRRAVIVVAPSPRAYPEVSVTQGTVYLVGPRMGTGVLATITSRTQGGTGLTVTGGAQVTVMDLVISGSDGGGASCTGSRLNLVRSILNNSLGAGVSASACTLTLDAVQLGHNRAGGLIASASTVTLTNSFVIKNGPLAGGLALSNASSGVLAFNTFVGNFNDGAGNAGIDCGDPGKVTVGGSIVLDNPQGDAGVSPACTLDTVIVGQPNKVPASGITGTPMFVDPANDNFRLVASAQQSADCCIDRIKAGPSTPNADHDVDSTHRPLGAGWDVGAHEAR